MPDLPARSAYWTYGLAFLGAHLAFMPLLVLLLPRRVEALAPDDPAVLLSWMLLVGGVVAGLAHILAGALSDLWIRKFGNRRGMIALGAALLLFAYAGFALVRSATGLFAAIVFFQLALNCCFSPLGVLLADHFPDEVKGRLSGLSNSALPASTLLIVPIAWAFPDDSPFAFLLIGSIAVLCMMPLLVLWRQGPVIGGDQPEPRLREPSKPYLIADFSIAWISRFLIQTGAAFVIGYIYLYIASMEMSDGVLRGAGPSEILALLTAPAATIAILATLLGGYISDLRSIRRVPLFIFACLFGAGMALLAASPQIAWFFVAYGLVQIGLAAFLSVDTALVAQLVGGHPKRGLLLGLMNLSNTFPSILVPTIAILAFADDQIAGTLATMFATLSAGALIAGVMVLFIRSVR